MSQPYGYTTFHSIDDVDAGLWQQATASSDNLFLDLRFLKAVELAFAHESQFRYVVVHDDSGTPIAATCFSSYQVDGALMAPPLVRRLAAGVRRVWGGFFKYRLLLCGVPVSTCSHQLAITAGADVDRVLVTLNNAAHKIARECGCWLISFKEFPQETTERINGLARLGYRKARSVYAYRLDGELGSFANYLTGRSKRTRANIRRNLRRLEEAGLTCELVRGSETPDALFSPQAHQLYLNVLERAKIRFETLPARFFEEVARQLSEDSHFAIIRQGERIVGFCSGISNDRQHAMLFCGLDYELNHEADLYANVVFRGLEQALVPGVQTVHIGAAADEFKQRMGCRGEWLAVYVRGANALMQLGLGLVFGLLFDTRDGKGAPPPAGHAREEASAEVEPETEARRAA